MRICVIIPAYNESANIAKLIQDIKKYQLEILVIDDGSSDNTFQIASNSGVQVMLNLDNQGKGASLIKGFKYALDNNFDAVITMDADGQHLAQDLPLFIEPAKNPDIHIILGNRMLNSKGMPGLRVITNKFMSRLISIISKQVIPDTQCGFRLIKKEVLQGIKLRTSKYETESEILIEASRLGFKITSLPIKSVYRREESKISPFIDTLRFIKFISKELWTMRY
ncbi:MAG: glycosyl transferase [Candidatus Omnitrophica bacterium CG23_combo_of_CG06-09_8_20_14_all_41_10]|uniref:Glycosyl transferase n=1 Tax=Candidatus Sherwoodlollariibacterium unditelluris TaxID=1974757 RepID=A0A2G9YI54_9BACT|nr:MAG: glycosyl transferase [Candidatus Omnitrophica bacterium CG23_combo_of_CG06-09_8_20_14_all_41_10]